MKLGFTTLAMFTRPNNDIIETAKKYEFEMIEILGEGPFFKNVDQLSKKIMRHCSNGLTHIIILWIISKEKIHGYGIMKKLDEFFSSCNPTEYNKTNSSKIYPILRKLEKTGIIKGEWGVSNNKSVKYYSLTEEGEILLKSFKSEFAHLINSPLWLSFIEDMSDNEMHKVENDEKCN